jgi:phosphoribosyl-ATP pyrophosphohydrolase/phosphoribosyl-AMP cyclohydrolase
MSDAIIHSLKFDRDGLIPTIVQDRVTGEVLMLAYMNGESLERTLQSGETWFWSRSRGELWHKGATSGHTQKVVDIRLDCDDDTLLVRVDPQGPACHTGERTCFFRNANAMGDHVVKPDATPAELDIDFTRDAAAIEKLQGQVSLVNVPAMELGIQLQDLFKLVQERKDQRPPNSYTSYLFNSGLDKILKKIGEESAETIIAAKNEGKKELASEITDLLYHLLVLMVEREVSLRDIVEELSKRAGRPK